MDERKIKIRLAIVGLFVFALFVINKEYLRPEFRDFKGISIILGCLPNFLGAYVFSLLPVERIIKSKNKNKKTYYYIYVAFIFIILMIEEYNPFFSASKTYDIYDIVASGVGCILAILTSEIITRRMITKKQVFSNQKN